MFYYCDIDQRRSGGERCRGEASASERRRRCCRTCHPTMSSCRVLHGVALSQRLAIRPSRALLASSAVRPRRTVSGELVPKHQVPLLGHLKRRSCRGSLDPVIQESKSAALWTRSQIAGVWPSPHRQRVEPSGISCQTEFQLIQLVQNLNHPRVQLAGLRARSLCTGPIK